MRLQGTLLDEPPGKLHDFAMTKTPYEKTFERAINLLSYKPRSLAEMRARLMEKDWAEETVVDQVLARLEE
ncbi:MAG: hypothetical protein ACREA2_05155, partial [Blastocatellia bacterium]